LRPPRRARILSVEGAKAVQIESDFGDLALVTSGASFSALLYARGSSESYSLGVLRRGLAPTRAVRVWRAAACCCEPRASLLPPGCGSRPWVTDRSITMPKATWTSGGAASVTCADAGPIALLAIRGDRAGM
jgi:hypothetical protein